MQRRDATIINKLVSECRELLALKEGYSLESFLADERTKRAISNTLINIGELVKSHTDEVREQYKHLPWRLITGLRNIAAHNSESMTMEDIWQTVENDVPTFLENLLEIQETEQG
jgi:uncharacterized protein with HEPN domain